MRLRLAITGIAVILAAVAVGVYQATRPVTPSRPEVRGEPGPEEREAAEDQLENLKKEIARGSGRPVTLSLTEGELNAVIGQALTEQQDDRVRDIGIGIDQDKLIVTGTVDVPGLPRGSFTAEGTVTARNGKLSLDVKSLRLGRLPLPGILRDRAKEAVESELQSVLRSSEVSWESARLEDERMVLSGVTI